MSPVGKKSRGIEREKEKTPNLKKKRKGENTRRQPDKTAAF